MLVTMKTPHKFSNLAGWIGRCSVALVALTIAASAFADTSKNVVVRREQQQIATKRAAVVAPKRQVWLLITGSAIPQPIDRVGGFIATTAIPMTVIGNHTGE